MTHAEKMAALKSLKHGEVYRFDYLVSLGFEPSRNQVNGVYDGPAFSLHKNYWGGAEFLPTPLGEEPFCTYWAYEPDDEQEPEEEEDFVPPKDETPCVKSRSSYASLGAWMASGVMDR